MTSPRAQAIARAEGSKTCEICLLLDVEDRTTKFHLYDEGYYQGEEKYVCDGCLESIKDIRKKCHQKFDSPEHKLFEDYIPWFTSQIPGMIETFRKNVTTK